MNRFVNRIGRRRLLALMLVGVGSGYLSGLFGVGGGIIIVPLLVMLGYDVKKASAISLGAVLISSTLGMFSYASFGEVNWLLAVLLSAGSVVGAQIGSRVLGRLSSKAVQLGFAGFLALVAASLAISPPVRDADVQVTLWSGLAAVAVGLVVGTMASILGIGGGVMVVPALILGFGAGDLLARGTAIAMMVPTSISGTIAHIRAGRADIAVSSLIGVGTLLTTTLGAFTAHALPPLLGNLLFAALVLFLAGQLVWRALRVPQSR